ncbi:SHC SH2 domain-binding protein 1-like isoform X2 [Acanthaster planci]|uniref:SHC SH2 domain-binding protein 1-like isoform X2 n=1 Tax=Acanthaster planci TaxID=133434 RepID=A0A8B7XWB9_ACAPL|nr:SHC SH2 domain-binding protein 1-like isoform X2 [Acanthaster planci]
MSSGVSEILVSDDVQDLNIPAKRQKICYDVDDSDFDNPPGAKNGNKRRDTTPINKWREIQDVHRPDVSPNKVAECLFVDKNVPKPVNHVNEDDPGRTDDDFRLPALKMPEVFDFSSLSYEDRRDGILKILLYHKPHHDVQQTFAYYVADNTSELRGYQAVWRSVDLACDLLVQMDVVLRESFPIMMTVEKAEPFCCLPGSTSVSVTEEQVNSYLKDHNYKVNVIELFPVHVDSGDIDEAALVVEHTRFFFTYIWRLSDVFNFMYGIRKFVQHHFQPRLKLYFDVMEKNVSPGLTLKYQNTITEYQTKFRVLRKKQDYIEKYDEVGYSDTDSDSDKDVDHNVSRDKDTSEKSGDNKKDADRQNCNSDKDNGNTCHTDKVMDSDIRVEIDEQDQGISIESDKNLVYVDMDDSDKHKEDIDSFGDKEQKSDQGELGDHSNNGKCGDISKMRDNDQDSQTSDLPTKTLPELEVYKIAQLWKDIEILEGDLEMMENPVMRHLMEIPRGDVEWKLKSAVESRQTRCHKEPVTHIVAEKITLGMMQDLQLPEETVVETHATPASAVASCYDDDTILILPGTYPGDGLNSIVRSVTIRGIGGPEDVVIVSKCRDPEDDLFVGCCGRSLSMSNMTFIDQSDSTHFRGLLEVVSGSTQLTNCRFLCSSTGVVVTHCHLDIQDCEIYGAQAPGLHAFQGSKLHVKGCYIHDCGKGSETSLQQLERKVPRSSTSVNIQGCKIQRSAGPGLLLKIYSLDKQEVAKTTDLSDLCSLTCRDLQVTDNDFSGNAMGVAMITYYKLKEW